MRRFSRFGVICAPAVLCVLALTVPAGGAGATTPPSLLGSLLDFGCANSANRHPPSLRPAAPTTARHGVPCFGGVLSRNGRGPALTKGPVGYGPTQIQSAYKLAGLHANGRTVA